MNKVFIIGNVTKDLELKTTQSGTATCTFSVAVNRPKNKEGKQETDYINVVVWQKLAEICCKYLGKGRKVAVEGEIRTRSYDNKQGQKVYVTEVLAQNVEFLSQKPGDAAGSPAPTEMTPADDDDMPF